VRTGRKRSRAASLAASSGERASTRRMGLPPPSHETCLSRHRSRGRVVAGSYSATVDRDRLSARTNGSGRSAMPTHVGWR
jgi:hypothetical protein